MKNTKKMMALLLVLTLVLGCAIGGTIAYLVAVSNTVTNTFTYGKIEIELAESNKTDKDGIEYTNVVPGDQLVKDPVVTVKQGSEVCSVYVLIDNQLGTAATYNINTANWIEVATSGTKVLYRYKETVNGQTAAQDLPVFTELTFTSELDKAGIDGLTGKNVVISAYAHQSENTTESVATAAAKAWAGMSN